MLIKLINSTLKDSDSFKDDNDRYKDDTEKREETEKYKAVLIMNSDATSTLSFFKILEFKQLEQLSLLLKMGDPDVINRHVQYRYNIAKSVLQQNQQKLQEICTTLKLKNPSLICMIGQ